MDSLLTQLTKPEMQQYQREKIAASQQSKASPKLKYFMKASKTIVKKENNNIQPISRTDQTADVFGKVLEDFIRLSS